MKNVSGKINVAAHRIRTDGALYSINDKKRLFNAWIMGFVYSNGLAYLPFITAAQSKELQTAMNSGIRAILSLPRFGLVQISELRRKLKIPSVDEISKFISFKAAWSLRESFNKVVIGGPRTRSRSQGNIPLPNESGWNGKRVSTMLIKVWNELPLALKNETNSHSLKRSLKKIIFSHLSQ